MMEHDIMLDVLCMVSFSAAMSSDRLRTRTGYLSSLRWFDHGERDAFTCYDLRAHEDVNNDMSNRERLDSTEKAEPAAPNADDGFCKKKDERIAYHRV